MYLKAKILLFLTLMFLPLLGQDIPEPMDNPKRLVNDFAGIFSDEQYESLEHVLRAYNDTTSTQIYVVTVTDLQGYAASDFATTLGQRWGVGQEGKDNGLVILIKPRIGNSRGDVFIATGYGVEHVLNDARVGRIIDDYMIPYFAHGDYYTGTYQAVEVIIQYLSGEFEGDPTGEDLPAGAILALLIILALFFISYTRGPKDNNHRGGNSSRGGGVFFPPLGGGRSSGGWGGGGFGGGGFGGGGGGSFGGGGAGRGF